jgi:hypothetical protein
MMKTTKKINHPLTDREKQTQPLPGETSPAEAHIKARQFAQKIKAQINTKGSKS